MESNRRVILITVCSLLVVLIGITYAYYSAEVQGTGNANAEASATTATLGEVEFNGTSTFDSTSFNEIYPGFIGIQTFTIGPAQDGFGIYEIDLAATVPSAFGNDIKITLYKTSDNINNYITRTEGTLTQGSDGFYKQDTVTIIGSLNKVYEGYLFTTNETILEQVEFSIVNDEFSNLAVSPDGYFTYYVVYEYVNRETSQNSQQDLSFESKITVKYAVEVTSPSNKTLEHLKQLNDALVITETTSSNPNYTKPAPSVDYNQTSGLFEAEDDYGTSYYFRGNVDYNYVKFGKWQTDYYLGNEIVDSDIISKKSFTTLDACEAVSGSGNCIKYATAGDDMYWRIVRINGDGSIRMIYDGTNAYGNDDVENGSTVFRSIGKSTFNVKADDNAYVGYMYGTPGSDNYADTHANNNNSFVKSELDNWYQTQMTSYDEYMSDTLFCNDRSVASSETFNYYSWIDYSQDAYGNNPTIYGAYDRQILQFFLNHGNKATLKCPQKNDSFTVSDVIYGNGDLTYPIGLITTDETNIAGANFNNADNYLAIGNYYWTMSPAESGSVVEYYVDFGYDGSFMMSFISDVDYPIRPVINIKGNSIIMGTGTAVNPFRIQ